jgi:hypothetical protein
MSSELPLCYFLGVDIDRRQTEEIKAEYFSHLVDVSHEAVRFVYTGKP